MAKEYEIHNFQSGDILYAHQMRDLDDQIAENARKLANLTNGRISYGSVDYWNANPTYIPEKGEIVVVSDYSTGPYNRKIPALKVGDGKAYVVDLPVTIENIELLLKAHVENEEIHTSEEERQNIQEHLITDEERKQILKNTQAIASLASDVVSYGNVEYWNSHADYTPKKGEIVVVSDYATSASGVPIPGIKVGDGKAYAIDLPVITHNIEILLYKHLNSDEMHVTKEERAFWNNKWRGYMSSVDGEELIFTTE